MDANEAKLQAILNSPNRYIVPVFQRYYSWELKNWEQLWEDIVDTFKATQKNKQVTHFMGSLVFIPLKSLPNLLPTFQIIDGQQRMMTITLLLCALRNVVRNFGFEEFAREINDTYLIHPYKNGLERYRVFPRHQDKEDFQIAITGEDEPGNRVGEALSFFTSRMIAHPYLVSESNLREFLQVIVSKLEFVHITLDNENPYQIFKSLNSTGVDLSEGDLIRNYVFMSLTPEKQEEFDERYWKLLELKFCDEKGNLDNNLISTFFRDFLMRNGDYVRQTETYQSFEKKYPASKLNADQLVSELHRSADFYNIIRGKNPHKNGKVQEALVKLRELDSSTTYPLVLKLMLLELSEDELEKAINWLSSFILRRFICQETSRAYGSWFVAACAEVKEKPVQDLIRFLIAKGFPRNARFKEQLLSFSLYGRRYTKSILTRIEHSLGHKEPVDLETAQVEHVMPQTLNVNWVNELGPNANTVHERLLNTIGNLTLTGYNPHLSNKPFSEKKETYAESNITITKEITKYDHWNETSILHRAKTLIELVVNIWKEPEAIDSTISETNNLASTPNSHIEKIRNMISRRGVSKGQLHLYRILFEAGDSGISWAELVSKMSRTRAQMAGVLGALGMRINRTEGLDDGQGISHILDLWEDNGEWFYRMKPELREAIEQEGIL